MGRVVTFFSRKLIKRIEDLTQESSALKTPLLPTLQTLHNDVPELVNFGFSLAQQVMPHLSEVRGTKVPFGLATILSYVKQCVSSTVGKASKDGLASWEAVAGFIRRLGQDINNFIQVAGENESVFKSQYSLYTDVNPCSPFHSL